MEHGLYGTKEASRRQDGNREDCIALFFCTIGLLV
jgi:hypothetical protein